MIYLDHAATTPMKDGVLQEMLPYLQGRYANANGAYAAARSARRAIDAARNQVAKLIGARPNEIYFTSGGSEADNWALTGVLNTLEKKRQVITTAIEHAAVLHTCGALEARGYPVAYLPVNCDGVVESEAFASAMTEETALLSVMLANNEIGTIQPVQQLAKIAHGIGILVHTDAVQAVGHIPVNVDQLGVDLLSMSAHKFGGPKGIGALYIRKGTRIDRFINGGEQEMGMRAGTENTAGIVGMGKAAELSMNALDDEVRHVVRLRDALIASIKERIPRAKINGESAARLPGHVHITIDEADSSMMLMRLDMAGIAASSGSACASGATERSHVLKAMGIQGAGQADIRFTIGPENTEKEIIFVVDVLEGTLRE